MIKYTIKPGDQAAVRPCTSSMWTTAAYMFTDFEMQKCSGFIAPSSRVLVVAVALGRALVLYEKRTGWLAIDSLEIIQ